MLDDNTPLVIRLLQQQLSKGNKVLIDFQYNRRHQGTIVKVSHGQKWMDDDTIVVIYEDGVYPQSARDSVMLKASTADGVVDLMKNADGALVFTNAQEVAEEVQDADTPVIGESEADAPLWVAIVNMLVDKGEKVYTWDGDNHDDDGIVCSIKRAKYGSDGRVYLLCDYADDWAGNGALAGTFAGEIVCDEEVEDYRFEVRRGVHWLLAPHE